MSVFNEVVVLFCIMLYHLYLVDSGKLQTSNPNIGVLDQSMTMHWNYSSNKQPTKITILVGQQNQTDLLKLWELILPSLMPLWKKTEIDSGAPEAVFNNKTAMTNVSTKEFILTLISVPSNIEKFRFVCKIVEDKWSIPTQEEIKIKLASQPLINFKVRNSNGNNTVGGRLEMVCAATGYPSPTVTIKKQSKSETVNLKSAPQQASYSIDSLQPSHNGKYICIAKNIAGDVEKDVLVEVKYKPIVTFTVVKEGSDDYAEMGTDVKMQCSAVGFPSPKLAISTKENSRVQEIQSSMNAISYSISNIQPNDTKTYVCSATNAAGASSKEKQINVKYIKSSSPASEDLIKKIGEVLKLKCDITGVPPPTFLWHKDGNKLPHTSPNLDVTFNNDASFGKYTCKASNIAGDRSVVFAIKKTYINRSNTKTNHILKLGQNKTLDCSIDGGPMIKHTWYKGKKKLAESRRLLIHVDKKDKFGNYTCVGKNRAGQEIILFSLKEQPKGKERGTGDSWKMTASRTSIYVINTLVFLVLNLSL